MSFIPSIILVLKEGNPINRLPTGLCGNFTGLWGKMLKEKAHKPQMLARPSVNNTLNPR
jgi:hypothetical protein